jgi:hypothetical protein
MRARLVGREAGQAEQHLIHNTDLSNFQTHLPSDQTTAHSSLGDSPGR